MLVRIFLIALMSLFNRIGFSVIAKRMTLNDPEWLFRIKFCFRTGLAGSDRATFQLSKNNCVKTNKDRHIL